MRTIIHALFEAFLEQQGYFLFGGEVIKPLHLGYIVPMPHASFFHLFTEITY